MQINGSQCGDAGVALLAAGLRNGCLPSLEALQLQSAQIGPQGASALATALTTHAAPNLGWLTLSENPLGDAGLVALAASLRQLPALARLHTSMIPSAATPAWPPCSCSRWQAPSLRSRACPLRTTESLTRDWASSPASCNPEHCHSCGRRARQMRARLVRGLLAHASKAMQPAMRLCSPCARCGSVESFWFEAGFSSDERT